MMGLIGLVWAAMTTFTYDVPATLTVRRYNHAVLGIARPFLPPRTLLVAEIVDPYADLFVEDFVIAEGKRDDFRDVPALVRTASRTGRPIRAVVRAESFAAMVLASAGQIAVTRLREDGEYVVASLATHTQSGR
jgi:hypothetical protein